MEVEAEVLDVSDAEAQALLLSIDPLAALARTQKQLHERLRELTPTDSAELRAVWEAAAQAALEDKPWRPVEMGPEQFLILLTCRDERHQAELLQRFHAEGLACKALLS
jgi:hypothetical protein